MLGVVITYGLYIYEAFDYDRQLVSIDYTCAEDVCGTGYLFDFEGFCWKNSQNKWKKNIKAI